jgi:hypothetical protein
LGTIFNTVKGTLVETPLLFVIVNLINPVGTPAGTVVVKFPSKLVSILACTVSKYTLFIWLILVPVIQTGHVTGLLLGLTFVIAGAVWSSAGSTKKLSFNICEPPLYKIEINPDFAVDGTSATTELALCISKNASVPFICTPVEDSKFVPVIVTVEPGAACVGVIPVIVGTTAAGAGVGSGLFLQQTNIKQAVNNAKYGLIVIYLLFFEFIGFGIDGIQIVLRRVIDLLNDS